MCLTRVPEACRERDRHEEEADREAEVEVPPQHPLITILTPRILTLRVTRILTPPILTPLTLTRLILTLLIRTPLTHTPILTPKRIPTRRITHKITRRTILKITPRIIRPRVTIRPLPPPVVGRCLGDVVLRAGRHRGAGPEEAHQEEERHVEHPEEALPEGRRMAAERRREELLEARLGEDAGVHAALRGRVDARRRIDKGFLCVSIH